VHFGSWLLAVGYWPNLPAYHVLPYKFCHSEPSRSGGEEPAFL
jgi:hypothetical protein